MKVIRCLSLALMLTPTGAGAQDLSAGLRAYAAGDYATALREWRPLAEQGSAHAQSNLGVMYAEGRGVLQDHAEAVRWYRAAAEQGNSQAQHNLGGMYALGRGVPQDYVTAHMWLNIAAANGEELSRRNRNIVADRMTPPALAEAQRRARACIASSYRDCG